MDQTHFACQRGWVNTPSAVLAYQANRFLSDAETMQLATTCGTMLRTLRDSYDLKTSCILPYCRRLQLVQSIERIGKITVGVVRRVMAKESLIQWDTFFQAHGSRIRELCFDHRFNEPLHPHSLPSGLTSLEFGYDFNQSLDSVQLPPSLHHVTFGADFLKQHSLARVQFPMSLETLKCSLSPSIRGDGGRSSMAGSIDDFHLERLPNLEHLQLGIISFPRPLKEVVWPASLLDLTICVGSADNIEGLVFPPGLRRLGLAKFDCAISQLRLPPLLEVLIFGPLFNQPISELVLPASLRALVFGSAFNQPVDQLVLPPKLESLRFDFSSEFDQPINELKLPASLLRLELLSGWFNQPIEGIRFPPSLTSLKFGWAFNQPIATVEWPPSLAELDLGGNFNHSLVKVKFPPRLRRFHLYWNRLDQVEGVSFPDGLTELGIGGSFNAQLGGLRFPPSLRTLSIRLGELNHPFHDLHLPAGLRTLDLGSAGLFNSSMDPNRWQLPHSLTEIVFGDTLQPLSLSLHGMGLQPSSLPSLSFNNIANIGFGQPVNNLGFPDCLRPLSFASPTINTPSLHMEDWRFLTRLELAGRFNQPVDDMMPPPNLVSLKFGHEFNQPVASLLPRLPVSLVRLGFGTCFNQPLDALKPDTLRGLVFLTVGRQFAQPLPFLEAHPRLIFVRSK